MYPVLSSFVKANAPRFAWGLVAAATAATALGVAGLRALPAVPEASPGSEARGARSAKSDIPTVAEINWSVIRPGPARPGAAPAAGIPLRLAGTFFEFTPLGSQSRKAVIEDLKSGHQSIVGESDAVLEYRVVSIGRERVILKDLQGKELALTLAFEGSGSRTNRAAGAGGPVPVAREGGGTERFGGSLVNTNSWVFSRDALMGYYRELMDNPERLVLVFDSLKPVYTPEGRISGYRLGVEGEKEFFQAVGLNEGDVIRKVNDIDMTNRRRAERMITQFAENRANVFVLAIERNGKPETLVYQVR